MKAPKSSQNVTKAWIQFMLSQYESQKNPEIVLEVLQYEVVAGMYTS